MKFRHTIKTITYLVSLFFPIISIAFSASSLGIVSNIKDIPSQFYQSQEKEWLKLGEYLVSSQHKTYIIDWAGTGGLITEGKQFIKSIIIAKTQGKTIIMRLIGPAMSMHAVVACYADIILYNTGKNYLLFHADTRGSDSIKAAKSRVTKLSQSHLKEEFLYCLNKGIISQTALNEMWEGYEVYKTDKGFAYAIDIRPVYKDSKRR